MKQVYSVFCCGSENWSWSQAILDRVEGWDTEAMRRLFRFRKVVDEIVTGYCERTAARTHLHQDEVAISI